MLDKVEMMNKIEKLDDKIVKERQQMYSCERLKLKNEYLIDDIKNTRTLAYAIKSFYYKRKLML